jgi:hypothetical protein
MVKIVQYSNTINLDNIKINDIVYGKTYLRKNLPYIIEFNKITNDYYLLDRDNLYMGYINVSYMLDIGKSESDWSRIYLYNDNAAPWNGKANMLNYISKYNTEKNDLNKCKNKVFDQLFDWFDL